MNRRSSRKSPPIHRVPIDQAPRISRPEKDLALNIKSPQERGYTNPDLLVTTDWLAERLDDPNVVVVDQDLPDNYARVHIPGAVVYQDHYYK